MDIHGRRSLDAPRDDVFDAICDPAMLLAVIPGCQAIERDGDVYRGRIALRIPGVSGTYGTVVRLVEQDRPVSGVLEGTVDGALGSIRGRATFRLAASGAGTSVEYDGHADLAGPLARLDGRFVESLASSLIGQGLGRLGAELRRARERDDAAGARA